MVSEIIIHHAMYNILYVDIDIYIGTKVFPENWFRKFILSIFKISFE